MNKKDLHRKFYDDYLSCMSKLSAKVSPRRGIWKKEIATILAGQDAGQIRGGSVVQK